MLAVLFLLMTMSIQHFSRKSPLPAVCWILLTGVLYGILARPTTLGLPAIILNPAVVLYILLPILIFDSARKIKLTRLKQIGIEAFILATVGVMATALVYAVFFYYSAIYLQLQATVHDALLFGAILSPTDPVAIGAIFKNIKINERLKLLIEGESLLNDGTSIILVSILSSMIFTGEQLTIVGSIGKFSSSIILAILCGIAFGVLAMILELWWRGIKHKFIGTLLPIVLSYLSFCTAQFYLEISGVISVMFTGITVVNISERKESLLGFDGYSKKYFDGFFNFCGELANDILFFCLGCEIGEFLHLENSILIPVIILAIILSRSVVVYAKPTYKKFILRRQAKWRWSHILNFAGLKGALSIALILLLPKTYPLRNNFLTAAFVMVLFTNIVNVLGLVFYLRKKNSID